MYSSRTLYMSRASEYCKSDKCFKNVFTYPWNSSLNCSFMSDSGSSLNFSTHSRKNLSFLTNSSVELTNSLFSGSAAKLFTEKPQAIS